MDKNPKAWDRFIVVVAVTLTMAWCAAYFASALLDHAPLRMALTQGPEESVLVFLGAKMNPLVSEGELHRLVAAVFLHSNLEHLLMNCVWLGLLAWAFARTRQSGTDFALIFIGGAMGGKLLSYAFGMGPSVGASGGVFALVGALIAALWRYDPARFTRRVVIVLFIPIVILALVGERVDHAAHLGGAVIGGLWGLFLSPRAGNMPSHIVSWGLVSFTVLLAATGLGQPLDRLDIPPLNAQSPLLGKDVELHECARLNSRGTATCVFEPGLVFAADITPDELLKRDSFAAKSIPRLGACHALTQGGQNFIMHRSEPTRIRVVATDINAWPLFRESIDRLIGVQCHGM